MENVQPFRDVTILIRAIPDSWLFTAYPGITRQLTDVFLVHTLNDLYDAIAIFYPGKFSDHPVEV